MGGRVRLKWHGARAIIATREGTNQGLGDAARHLLEVSRQQVPIEEGTLERSGEASQDEARMRSAVAYSGPYAVRQHEELGWKHDAGRKAKYLEDPMNSERPTLLRLIARSIKRKQAK